MIAIVGGTGPEGSGLALRWARAGEQIDRAVNSTLLPNSGVTPVGDVTRPQFSFQETGFWAQGVNVGIDCRW